MMKLALYIALICCLTTLLMAVPASAQTGGVKAKISFDFVVAGKSFSAGEYTMNVASHRVDIRNANGRKVAVLSANEISGRSTDENGFLIFQCHGGRCFLSEVWSPSYENGLQIPNSRWEEQLPKKDGAKIVAVRGEQSANWPHSTRLSAAARPSSVKHN